MRIDSNPTWPRLTLDQSLQDELEAILKGEGSSAYVLFKRENQFQAADPLGARLHAPLMGALNPSIRAQYALSSIQVMAQFFQAEDRYPDTDMPVTLFHQDPSLNSLFFTLGDAVSLELAIGSCELAVDWDMEDPEDVYDLHFDRKIRALIADGRLELRSLLPGELVDLKNNVVHRRSDVKSPGWAARINLFYG